MTIEGPMSLTGEEIRAIAEKNKREMVAKLNIEQLKYYHKEVPRSIQMLYLKVTIGNSRALAVKLNCLECTNWSRRDITECDMRVNCALWKWRPYQGQGQEDEE